MSTEIRTASGMRPTGPLHLGHYFGVLKNWVDLQDKLRAFFFVADWHALTTDFNRTEALRENTIEMVKDWIGSGLDPEKCTIFRQSDLKEHAELSLLLSMITPVSWVERNPTYKEQQQQITTKDLSCTGFLCYPILMAADILMYKPQGVPVGEDQLPHMELTREIARRFNGLYGDYFPEPQAMLTPACKCPGLDGRKMSKSYNNGIFLRDSFGALMKNINDHYERMEIVRPAYEKFNYLPLWALLRETVNLNSRDKAPSPAMAGATARAIFSGARYPASLLEAVMLRIRAERDITWGKAAIIKAYYLKNPHEDCPKEVLTVSLNEASTNPAYTLGRLFSVYEAVQQAANPGINATIKDKYFNSAAAMPASIFPVLNNLCQKHLRKLDARQRVYYDKQIMKLKGVLNENYPARMTLAQQGSFDLGYYHQTQKRYTKKEEKENV